MPTENFPGTSWIWNEISCTPQTAIVEMNDSVQKPERGELGKGSNLPSACWAHATIGDVRRAWSSFLIQIYLVAGEFETETTIVNRSPTSGKLSVSGSDRKPQYNAGNLSRRRTRTNTRPRCHLNLSWACLNREGGPWVISASVSRGNRSCCTT